jgi:hypothetical protein
MSYQLAPFLRQQFYYNGAPLIGGQLFSYLAGTTTPAATYTDSTGATPNTNPVVLDSNASAEVWLASATNYKFVLEDSLGDVIWTVDQVSASGGTGGGTSAWTTHAVTDGQSATNLTGETCDISLYAGAIYDVHIIRGTATVETGRLYLQNVNGTGRVVIGEFIGDGSIGGVTFSITQTGTVLQLQAALSSGPGSGFIIMQHQFIP